MSEFTYPPPEPQTRPTAQDPPTGPPGRTLPPEVEAELRRQAEAEASARLAQRNGEERVALESAEVAQGPRRPSWADRLRVLGPIGAVLIFVATKLKWLAAFKFVPALTAVLKTGGSMLISIWYYAWMGGWQFGVGFVVGILVHEMGHVLMAWRFGHPITAPLFIPGFGAIIFHRRELTSAFESALIGIAGPIAGTLIGLAFMLAHYLTGAPVLMWLAYVTFVMNLFNMAPFHMLDGGWITGAISPRLWVLGIVVLAALFVNGTLRSPLVLLLLIVSLPAAWHGIRTGDCSPLGKEPATARQKLWMGLAYLGLCGVLAWLTAVSYVPMVR